MVYLLAAEAVSAGCQGWMTHLRACFDEDGGMCVLVWCSDGGGLLTPPHM